MEEVEEGTKDSPPIARSDAVIAMADIRTMMLARDEVIFYGTDDLTIRVERIISFIVFLSCEHYLALLTHRPSPTGHRMRTQQLGSAGVSRSCRRRFRTDMTSTIPYPTFRQRILIPPVDPRNFSSLYLEI
jgi:hypothetical protein